MSRMMQWLQNRNPHLVAGGLFLVMIWMLWPEFFVPGQIIFGDLDFGFHSAHYLQRMASPWNELWSNPNFFNLPRLPLMWVLTGLFGMISTSGGVLLKGFLLTLLWGGCMLMYGLLNRMVGMANLHRSDDLPPWWIWAIAVLGAVIYALNPWVIFRIQHIYLLVGYMLLPLTFWAVLELTEAHSYRAFFQPKTLAWALLGAGSWAMSTAAVHYLVFTFLIVGAWGMYRMVGHLARGYAQKAETLFLRYLVLGVTTLALLAYFLVPQLAAMMTANLAPNNVNTVDSIVLFSRHSNWVRVLLGVSYWWPIIDINALPRTFFMGGFALWGVVIIGLIMALRERFVRFFWGLLVVFGLLSFGTAGPLRGALLWGMFHSPIAGTVGFLFRDPNKFAGLFLFCFAVLFALSLGGMVAYLRWRSRIWRKEQILLKALKHERTRRQNPWRISICLVTLGVMAAMFGYVSPVARTYFSSLYHPVGQPLSYRQMSDYLEKEDTQRTLLLPRFEAEKTPGHDFALATWNGERPTASADIYSVKTPTFNPNEGANPAVGTVYRYIADLLQSGKTTRLMPMLAGLGVDMLGYHTDLAGHDDAHATATRTLGQHAGDGVLTRFGDMHLRANPAAATGLVLKPGAMGLVGGLQLWDLLSSISFIDQTKWALTWLDQAPNDLRNMPEGSVFAGRFNEDPLLQLVDDRHKTTPFDQTDQADAFTRWGKTRTSTADWAWHLGHVGLTDHPRQSDAGAGLAFTYAPKMLDIAPFEDMHALGKPFIDTEHFADEETDFFTPEDPEVAQVQFAPTSAYDDLPFLRGEIQRGDTAFWKVVTSRFIDVEPENAYVFGMTLSGKDTHQLHGKVKYYDADENELTVSYVSAPERVESFDFLKFQGTFITPPHTAKIKLQLWTHQRPTQQLQWWVHGLTVRDLAQHVQPNVLAWRHPVHASARHVVYARVLHSPAGGVVRVTVGDLSMEVETQTKTVTRWAWVPLGELTLPAGFAPVSIENKEGFNAVNQIGIIPEKAIEDAQKELKKIQKKTKFMTVADPVHDLLWNGNLQTKTQNPALTNGRGLRLHNGETHHTVDMPAAGPYRLHTRVRVGPNQANVHKIGMQAFAQGLLIEERDLPLNRDETGIMWIDSGILDLPSGRVQLTFSLQDNHKSLLNTDMFHSFRPDMEWTEKERYLDTLGDKERNQDCCDCVDLGPEYLRLKHTKKSDTVNMDITPGCSCWWVISATDVVPVLPENEYWIRFQARAEFARNNHFKLIFLDENKLYLGYHILQHTPTENTYDWTDIERIVAMPEHATHVQLQVWSRQNRFTNSRMGIRNLMMKRWRDLPVLDGVLITQGKDDLESFFALPEAPNMTLLHDGPTAKTIQIEPHEQSVTLQLDESFSPLWNAKTGETPLVHTQGNYILNQYVIPPSTTPRTVHVRFAPQRWFVWGRVLSLLVLVGFLGWYAWLKYTYDRAMKRGRLMAKNPIYNHNT